MDNLVKRLARGRHPVTAARAKSPEDLKESIERGFVLLKFTDTGGGTELGVELDEDRSVCAQADFVEGRGNVKLVGTLMLNYDKVELHADIDLATLSGEGNLTLIAEETEWRESDTQVEGRDVPVH